MVDMLSKICKKFQKKLLQKIFKNRDNSPYLSGDTFAHMCQMYIAENDLRKPHIQNQIIASKIIFVEGHCFEEFIKEYGDLLLDKILLSGNSDQNFPNVPFFPMPPKMVFCQNNASKNNVFFRTLPLGIENIKLVRSGFKSLHKPRNKFTFYWRILIPPMSISNSVRSEIIVQAKNLPHIFDVHEGFRSKPEYFRLVRKYKFVFVCEGNGYDTHRLWEVLYQNSFPILIKSNWSDTLSHLELPILIIDSISKLDTSILENHFAKFGRFEPRDYQVLWAPYWKNLFHTMTKSES